MGKKAPVVMPKTARIFATMGEQIKLARLRRNIPVQLVSDRADISRRTLISIEKGCPTVSIGMYAAVLHTLNGLDKDVLLVAKDDELGKNYKILAC